MMGVASTEAGPSPSGLFASRRSSLSGANETMMLLVHSHAPQRVWDLSPHALARLSVAILQTATGHMQQMCDLNFWLMSP